MSSLLSSLTLVKIFTHVTCFQLCGYSLFHSLNHITVLSGDVVVDFRSELAKSSLGILVKMHVPVLFDVYLLISSLTAFWTINQ